MKSAFCVSLFSIFISMLVLAQSNRTPIGKRPNGMPVAPQLRPALPHGALFAQHRAAGFDTTTPRRHASPTQGGLNFAPAVVCHSGGAYSDSVAVADLNGDGKPDLLVVNQCADPSCNNGSMSVLLGNGDGTFQTAVSYGSGGTLANFVAVSDVNGDGKLDVIIANECPNNNNCPVSSNGAVGVLLGNGDGTFQTAVSYGSGGWGRTRWRWPT